MVSRETLLNLPELLRPAVQAATAEPDRVGDLSDGLLAELRDSGVLALLTPRSLGGLETTLSSALRVYEGIGRLDASVAWTVWNANFGFVGALLEEDGRKRLWSTGQEPVFTNATSVPGTAVPADGGYRVSGTWPVVSNVRKSDWVVALAVVTRNGEPLLTSAQEPDARLFALRREQLLIKDSRDVTGLRGSGSHQAGADEVRVPASLVARLDVPPLIDAPLYRGYLPALVLPGSAAVVLGAAQAAIDEFVRIAAHRQQWDHGSLADVPHVQEAVARSDAAVHAARLLLLSAATTLDEINAARRPVTLEHRAALRSAVSNAAVAARQALLSMFELGGSSSVCRGDRLERLTRDGLAVLQHVEHSSRVFEAVGRVRLGRRPSQALF